MRIATDEVCRGCERRGEVVCSGDLRVGSHETAQGQNELHVPELILSEFSNIIWKKLRRGELTAAEGTRIVTAFSRKKWTIHSHRQTLLSAYAGAEVTGQTVYDWTYLALAISLSCEFVTADERFFKALATTEFESNLKWIADV